MKSERPEAQQDGRHELLAFKRRVWLLLRAHHLQAMHYEWEEDPCAFIANELGWHFQCEFGGIDDDE